MPKFSIITVCYNSIEGVRATMESVQKQSFDDYEYIFVDGASNDGTVDLIREYAEADARVRYISESDSGLYDAMNKALTMADGDYIQFLNAGDSFYDESVLHKVSSYIDEYSSKHQDVGKIIFYGNITYVNPDGSEEARLYGSLCGKSVYYATGDCVNHQACFASRSCFKSDGHDFDNINLKICADRDWMMRQSRQKALWIPIGEMIVRYDLSEDSVSVRDKELLRSEERICMRRYYPGLYPVYILFDFCRNNRILSGLLHSVYRLLFIRR